MILEHDPRAPRWSTAALCLTLLLAALVSGAASRRPGEASGSRSDTGLTSCGEGTHGSFEGFDYDSESGHDFSLQHRLSDGRRLCARVRGEVRFDAKDGRVLELPPGSSVLVETRAGRRSQRMRITSDQGQPRYEWWLNGEPRTPDDAARAWLKDALQVIAGRRDIGSIQGQVGSLQGEIGSIRGEVGSLQGDIGSVQGRVGSLQGNVGSIQGERGSLQGAIGGHQGAIGGLERQITDVHADERIREIEDRMRPALERLKLEVDRLGS